MNKKIFLIIIIALFSLTTTGCWNYRELSDLAIITGIGIDKMDDKYKISMLIANTAEFSSSTENKAKTTILSGTGYNIAEAINDIKLKSSKELYTGHLSLLLVNEDIAKESIYDIIDPLIRDPEAIKRVNLVIAKNSTCNDILKVLSPLDSLPSQNIIENIKTSATSLGISYDTHLSDFIYKMVNDGYDNMIPSISIEGHEEEENTSEKLKEIEADDVLKVDNIALFNRYKLVDYANKEESKIINVLTNTTNSINIYSSCYNNIDDYLVTKIDSPETKIDVEIKNDKPHYTFDITATGSIDETNCKVNLNSSKVIKEIADYAKSDIYDLVKKTIEKTKDNKSDIFGLGNILYKKDYKYWNKVKDDWDNIYSKLDYDIKISLNIKTKGALETTLKEEDK